MSEKKNKNDKTRYFYVFLTEDLQVSEQSKHTPQHITLIPPFIAEEQDVLEVAKETIVDFNPFDVELGGQAMFGPNKDIPVILIQPNEILNMLHMALTNRLKNRQIDIYKIYKNQFTDDQFTPHITLKKLYPEPDTSRPITVDHIAVIKKAKNIKTILAKEKLGRSSEV